MSRLFWHVFAFGVMSPYLGAVAILAVAYLNRGMAPYPAILVGGLGVLYFSPILIPLSIGNYIVYRILFKYCKNKYKEICLALGVFFGSATGIMLFPVLDNLQINLILPPLIGGCLGLLTGCAVLPLWKPTLSEL